MKQLNIFLCQYCCEDMKGWLICYIGNPGFYKNNYRNQCKGRT